MLDLDARDVRIHGKGFLYPLRTIVVLLGARVAQILVIQEEPGQLALFEVLLLKSGLFLQLYVACGLPYMFRTNLPVSCIELTFIAAMTGHGFCSSLESHMSQILHQTWFSLDQMALRVLEGMFGLAVHDTAVCPCEGGCMQLFAFLQVGAYVKLCCRIFKDLERNE